jgi:16S rRNA (guanine966-N2)-methyltransferase
VRVVAGSAGGRLLRSPAGDATRPTPERVREAVFNALFSIDALDGAVVADLYAGSGAMGIEALSRGAAHAHFVEQDPDAVDVIVDNLDTLGFGERSTVVAAPVETSLHRLEPAPDLVVADPPYAFDGWAELLTRLAEVVAPDALVVVESGAEVEMPAAWEKMRDRTYGGTVITFAARTTPRS